MFCPMCGFKNLDTDNFCGSCGHDLRSEEVHSLDFPTPEKEPRTQSAFTFTASRNLNLEYSGFWRRFIAFWFDRAILIIPTLILSALLNALLMGRIDVGHIPGTLSRHLFEYPAGSARFTVVLADIILVWLYFALFESSKMQGTPGKRIMGVRVTDFKGNRILFGRATLRHFSKLISTLIIFAGFLMIAISRKKQGLHDKIAGCLVLKTKTKEP